MLDTEDEYHFVLKRDRYIDIDKYYMNPNLHKFNMLFSSRSEHVLLSSAKIIYYALERRSELLKSLE